MTKHTLNFRATAGAWEETPPAGAVLGTVYPASIAGLTAGWSVAPTTADYASATDARHSGRNSTTTTGTTLRVDLPNGPGTYRLWLSMGTLQSTISSGAMIYYGALTTPIVTIPLTSIVSTHVLDASGALITKATFLATGGTYIQFTTTQGYIRIGRNTVDGGGIYINCLQIEAQVAPLVDAVLSDEYGVGTHGGTILAQEVADHQIGKIASANGVQVFSVVGAAATYFTVQTRNGAPWLVTTATRLPNGWSGNVTIRQTTPDETRDTNIPLTATAFTRPLTGYLGRCTSETLRQRKVVLDVMAAERWAGYTGQSFASDQVATSASDLVSKINALTPDGTSWYRIRLQNGTYTGTHTLTARNFGTGGLLIEPDTGHDPMFNARLDNCHLRKCHWRNMRIVPVFGAGAGAGVFNGGIGSGIYALWKFSGNRIGNYFDPAYSLSNWASWSDFFRLEFVEQFVAEDNVIDGISNFVSISGGRIWSFRRNEFRAVVRDFHALTTAYRFNTPRGVFADDISYGEIVDCSAWLNPDIYTGLSGGATPHGDWVQMRRVDGYGYAAGANGSTSTPWPVGANCVNAAEGRVYVVTSVQVNGPYAAGIGDPNLPPTGTGTGIITGGITFAYVEPYTVATTMHLLLENNCIHATGATVNAVGDATPNVQFYLHANQRTGNIYNVCAINNICASSNIRGIDNGLEGDVWAEMNSFVAGAQKPLDNDQANITGKNVRAARNITGLVSGAPYIGGVKVMAEHNAAVNFKAGSTAPNRPGDVLKGTFVDTGATGWGYAMTDDRSITAPQFRSAMSRQMHHVTGAAGAKLREVHTITLTGTGGPRTADLVVQP